MSDRTYPEPSTVYQEDSGYDPISDLARVVAQLTERVEATEREVARLRALHPPTVADVEVRDA